MVKARNVGDFFEKSRKKKKNIRKGFFNSNSSAPNQHKTKAHFKKPFKTGIYRDF